MIPHRFLAHRARRSSQEPGTVVFQSSASVYLSNRMTEPCNTRLNDLYNGNLIRASTMRTEARKPSPGSLNHLWPSSHKSIIKVYRPTSSGGMTSTSAVTDACDAIAGSSAADEPMQSTSPAGLIHRQPNVIPDNLVGPQANPLMFVTTTLTAVRTPACIFSVRSAAEIAAW